MVTRKYATVACHAGALANDDAGGTTKDPGDAGLLPDAGVALWEPLSALPPGYTCESSGIEEPVDGCSYDRHQSGRIVRTCTHTSAPYCR